MTQDLLHERGKTYGTFKEQALIGQGIKFVIHEAIENRDMVLEADQREALEMIATKMARIINGDPNYIDNWRDIAGYATLVADRLDGTVQ